MASVAEKREGRRGDVAKEGTGGEGEGRERRERADEGRGPGGVAVECRTGTLRAVGTDGRRARDAGWALSADA